MYGIFFSNKGESMIGYIIEIYYSWDVFLLSLLGKDCIWSLLMKIRECVWLIIK